MKVSCASDGFCLSVRVVCHVAGSKTVLRARRLCVGGGRRLISAAGFKSCSSLA